MILNKSNVKMSYGDPKVWNTIDKCETDFVFQFASPGMKNLIAGSIPQTTTQLAELNALFRPGPIEAGFIEKYLAIKQGKDAKLTTEEEIIMSVLKKVFGQSHPGLMIFQEDVMRICTECAGFTMTEADDIRRAMGKKKDEVLAVWEQPFCDNWHEGGDPTKVWDALKGFAHYAFNKSHSVAYAIIAYATAKIWTYQRDECLEYLLNGGTKDDFTNAIEKCKDLKMRMDYPSIETLGGTKYKIAKTDRGNSVLTVPIECPKHFNSYVSLLFDDEVNVAILIYKGVCDKLHPDRYALAELATTLLSKARKQALFMEPEGQRFNTIEQILDGLKLCGGVVDWTKDHFGNIDVKVQRANGKPASEVHFLSPNNPMLRARQVKLDMKYFGTVRNGILSDMPYIEHESISNQLERIKQTWKENGHPEKAYEKMRNCLSDYMRDYFSNPDRRIFPNVYCVLNDIRIFDKSAKITVTFNDMTDIFYIGKDYINMVRSAPKNALLRLKMDYSPFVNKRREEYVYDFDILDVEVIPIELK